MKLDLHSQTAKIVLAIHYAVFIAFCMLFGVYEIWHFYSFLFGR